MKDLTADLTMHKSPIVIIGGGLAGSAAGAVLAQNGFAPTIIERDTFPRDKLCGEFLSGESGRLLKRIGCLDELLGHDPPRITNVRFISARGHAVDVPLPEPAFGISRRLLDETLFRHAGRSGAQCLEGHEIRQISSTFRKEKKLTFAQTGTDADETACDLQPAVIIAAYGRHSRLDRDLKRPFVQKMETGVGLKLHHRIAGGASAKHAREDLQERAEIYGFDGGYCGVCRVEDDRVNVCMLLQKHAFKEVGSFDWASVSSFLRSRNPLLAKRLQTLTPCSDKPITVSGMPFSMKEQSQDDILFAGDAAGMIVPLCGDGQAMALEAGIGVAELLSSTFSNAADITRATVRDSRIAQTWTTQWQTRFTRRMRLGRMLQHAMFHPAMADLTIRALQIAPENVIRRLATATRSTPG